MQPNQSDAARQTLSDRLLLLLILSLPLMKPALAYPVVLPDLIFAALLLAFMVEIVSRGRNLSWDRGYWVLLIYVGCLVPSLLATPDLARSLFKLTTQLYLISLALLTALLVQTEEQLRKALLAWLAATAVVVAVSIAGLATFPVAPQNALIDYARFHFGTLPPGSYPRLSSTFLNANMACNYLSVSAIVLLAARACGWVPRGVFVTLLAGTMIAALATISPGLGGIALVLGLWLWLRRRDSPAPGPRLALFAGIAAALAFVVATAITPVLHATAPFLIPVPGTDVIIAPSARWMLWSGSFAEFARHPIVGHGIGIDATFVRYLDPSGNMQIQTDAHNVFLNIAAQCGLLGLAGLAVLLTWAVRLSSPWRPEGRIGAVRVALGLGFLGAFAYQGLGGSFEDTRHLWVLLGLLIASARLSRWDGNNRRAGVPLPG